MNITGLNITICFIVSIFTIIYRPENTQSFFVHFINIDIIALQRIVLYWTVPYCFVLLYVTHSIVPLRTDYTYTVLYCIAYWVVLYHSVLYCTVPFCAVLKKIYPKKKVLNLVKMSSSLRRFHKQDIFTHLYFEYSHRCF